MNEQDKELEAKWLLDFYKCYPNICHESNARGHFISIDTEVRWLAYKEACRARQEEITSLKSQVKLLEEGVKIK